MDRTGERPIGWISDYRDRRFSEGARQVGIAGRRDLVEQREIGQGREQASGEDDRLAPDAVGQPAEQDEARRAKRKRGRDKAIGGRTVEVQRLFEEEECVELACVPNSAIRTIRRFAHRPKLSRIGALDWRCSATMCTKNGLSCSRNLIQSDAASSKPDTRKGMRQHQASNCASPSNRRVDRITARERNKPTVAVA